MRAHDHQADMNGSQMNIIVGANLFVLLLIGMCQAAYSLLY